MDFILQLQFPVLQWQPGYVAAPVELPLQLDYSPCCPAVGCDWNAPAPVSAQLNIPQSLTATGGCAPSTHSGPIELHWGGSQQKTHYSPHEWAACANPSVATPLSDMVATAVQSGQGAMLSERLPPVQAWQTPSGAAPDYAAVLAEMEQRQKQGAVPNIIDWDLVRRLIPRPSNVMVNSGPVVVPPDAERVVPEGTGCCEFNKPEVQRQYSDITLNTVLRPMMAVFSDLRAELHKKTNSKTTDEDWLQLVAAAVARDPNPLTKDVTTAYTFLARGNVFQANSALLSIASRGLLFGTETRVAMPVQTESIQWRDICALAAEHVRSILPLPR